MIRVFDFRIEGMPEPIKVASMSHAQAKKFVQETRDWLKDKEPPEDAEERIKWAARWQERTSTTVCEALNTVAKAGGGTNVWNVEKLQQEFDGPTIDAMFLFVREKSGLVVPAGDGAGEVKAA